MNDIFKAAAASWKGAKADLKSEQQAVVTGVENELQNLLKTGALGAAGSVLPLLGVNPSEVENTIQPMIESVEGARPDWMSYINIDPNLKLRNLGDSSVNLSGTVPIGPVDMTAGGTANAEGFTNPYLRGSVPLGAGNISGLIAPDSIEGQYTSENNIWNAGFRHNLINGGSSVRAGIKIPFGGG
tara:strand:+ start:335 stop:889 length:555 start_codon:yes stop_codon:yes gene_type:complete